MFVGIKIIVKSFMLYLGLFFFLCLVRLWTVGANPSIFSTLCKPRKDLFTTADF